MASTEQSEANPSSPAAGGNFGANEWLVEEMYERYRRDPASVDAAWHDFFVDYRPADAVRAQDGPPARPTTTETKSDAVPKAPELATARVAPTESGRDGQVATVTLDLTTSTNLRLVRGASPNDADIGWYVVEFGTGCPVAGTFPDYVLSADARMGIDP